MDRLELGIGVGTQLIVVLVHRVVVVVLWSLWQLLLGVLFV